MQSMSIVLQVMLAQLTGGEVTACRIGSILHAWCGLLPIELCDSRETGRLSVDPRLPLSWLPLLVGLSSLTYNGTQRRIESVV